MSVRCRLEGGPFDGDRGRLTGGGGPPAELFAVGCFGCLSGERCASGGVHWFESRVAAEQAAALRYTMSTVELYLYGRRDRMGYHVYVYGELTTEGYDLLAEEGVDAPAPAAA